AGGGAVSPVRLLIASSARLLVAREQAKRDERGPWGRRVNQIVLRKRRKLRFGRPAGADGELARAVAPRHLALCSCPALLAGGAIRGGGRGANLPHSAAKAPTDPAHAAGRSGRARPSPTAGPPRSRAGSGWRRAVRRAASARALRAWEPPRAARRARRPGADATRPTAAAAAEGRRPRAWAPRDPARARPRNRLQAAAADTSPAPSARAQRTSAPAGRAALSR